MHWPVGSYLKKNLTDHLCWRWEEFLEASQREVQSTSWLNQLWRVSTFWQWDIRRRLNMAWLILHWSLMDNLKENLRLIPPSDSIGTSVYSLQISSWIVFCHTVLSDGLVCLPFLFGRRVAFNIKRGSYLRGVCSHHDGILNDTRTISVVRLVVCNIRTKWYQDGWIGMISVYLCPWIFWWSQVHWMLM